MESLPEIRLWTPKFRLHLAAGDNTAGKQHGGGVGVEEAPPAAVCNCNGLVGICSRSTRRGSAVSY
jgi:hypothetical protein